MPIKSILYLGNKLASLNRTPTAADILPGLLEEEGFKVYSYSSKKNKILRLIDMLFRTLVLASKVDWVIIDVYSTQNFWYAYLCGMICKFKKVSYINILHGGNLENRLKRRYFSFFNGATYNIAPSKFLHVKFMKAGVKNLEFIPNSIVLNEYKFRQRKMLKPKLIWVRAFAEIYNPFLAIQLLEKLLENYSEAELFMVGPRKDSSFEKCLDYVRKYKLPVHFTGKLEKHEWHQLSEKCDIFLNTSTVDNTPISIIEAMALGLPIISSRVGGIPFLIDDHVDGVLFENRNLQDFTNKTINLLENRLDFTEISKTARKKVHKFSWEVVKELWLNLLT